MANIKYTYKWTGREDYNVPNNNYNDTTETIIVEPPYTFLDWLNDNTDASHAEQVGDTYYIIDNAGNRTGEAFMVIDETETDEPIN